ncbi:hypothetical protein Slin15195_G046350 [Septoria linicola]|uniref:Uncharacterized protein n=1 Tax=Septoria linicola TaxID=215465 RepID=A0A9Q9EH05_9PEZI|nr:hypothetical protein Slin14017_G049880 [Septoria linicola]USW51316.1 hypothetical protein Slin15195_G046350 [Septoria linicola]
MTRSKHAVLAVSYSNFAQILQDTPELDQAAAIAAVLPRELKKLYVLAVEGGLETPFGIESQQQTPFHELQALMPTLESVVCVPWGYYDGRYVQKCVDYRVAKELELPMICELDGIEPLERPTNGEKWKIRYQKPPMTVFDYYDMIA